MDQKRESADVPIAPRLWSVEDISAYLGVPVATVYHWRTKGYGPVGIRVGRFVRFREADVLTWVDTAAEVA